MEDLVAMGFPEQLRKKVFKTGMTEYMRVLKKDREEKQRRGIYKNEKKVQETLWQGIMV